MIFTLFCLEDSMPRCAVLALFGVVGLMGTRPVFAGDWPMWRFDAGRGGVSPQALPETL
jgi:hypothetical protein